MMTAESMLPKRLVKFTVASFFATANFFDKLLQVQNQEKKEIATLSPLKREIFVSSMAYRYRTQVTDPT